MAAVIREAGGPFRIEPVVVDSPRDDEVLVRIVATGLCHTDLAVRDRHLPMPLPAVLGHEGAGIVERCGAAITKVAPGDRVVLTFRSCGVCHSCLRGQPSYCRAFGRLNFRGSRDDGSPTLTGACGAVHGAFFGQSSFATHALAGERNIVRVTDDVPLELLGPLGCGVQTGAGAVMNALDCARGDAIAIIGGGSVGLSALLAALVRGCDPVIVMEPDPDRRALARSLGATHVVDPARVSLGACLQAHAIGSLDHVLDTTAIAPLIEEALGLLGWGGRIALVGVPPDPAARLSLPFSAINGRTVMGVIECAGDPDLFLPELIDLYRQGRFPFDRLVTTYPWDKIDQAVADTEAGRAVKAVITWTVE